MDGINAYTCDCMPGYEGTLCQTEIDECSSIPCLNGGLCTDLIAGYNCSCMAGFQGVNCEVNVDECASMPCLNGGEYM